VLEKLIEYGSIDAAHVLANLCLVEDIERGSYILLESSS